MTKKRILLVGDANHQFITNYAFWLKRELGLDITIDVLSNSPIKDSSFKFFDNSFQIDFKSNYYKFFSKITGVRRVYRILLYKKLILSFKKYDFFHFHFIDIDSFYLTKIFKKKYSCKIILSIWGSDLYKLKERDKNKFINVINEAHIITFTNEKSSEYFKFKFNWEKDNLRICRFGLAPLDNLKRLKLSKSECKRSFGIIEDKIVITVGYNLSPTQQHLKILDEFGKEELGLLKDKIVLFFPITYGGTLKYKNELLNKIKELPFVYFIFDSFLSDEEIALIRKASDIMIQLQESDQFSGSMQEHLFAENIVITGSWLPYKTLKVNDAWFCEVDEINEIVNIVPNIISNYSDFIEKTRKNSKAILNLSSWELNINSWINLYDNK